MKHKDLEIQLMQAKHDQATLQLQDEQEKNSMEKELVSRNTLVSATL